MNPEQLNYNPEFDHEHEPNRVPGFDYKPETELEYFVLNHYGHSIRANAKEVLKNKEFDSESASFIHQVAPINLRERPQEFEAYKKVIQGIVEQIQKEERQIKEAKYQIKKDDAERLAGEEEGRAGIHPEELNEQ